MQDSDLDSNGGMTGDRSGGDWWQQNQPATPAASGDPWTPQELSESQTWANNYYASHQIPASWGTPDDIANSYVAARRAGASHADAMAQLATVPTQLGWDKYQAPGTMQAKDPVTPNPVVNPGNPGAVPLGVPTSGFGAAPTPYSSNPDAPAYTPMPTYVPQTWTGGDYVNPTEADLLASPGYQARLDASLQARNRSAAAQGTVLNGGTLKALDRTAQDYATNEYQTLRNNTYDAYVQKYKQFTDAAGLDLAARTANANENQNTFANRTATYNTGNARTLSDYITNVTNNRNAELDYWNRLQDVNQTGANLAGNSR